MGISNVAISGHWKVDAHGSSGWSFAGLDGVEQATSVNEALEALNAAGYELIAVTEDGGPGLPRAYSYLCLYGRRTD